MMLVVSILSLIWTAKMTAPCVAFDVRSGPRAATRIPHTVRRTSRWQMASTNPASRTKLEEAVINGKNPAEIGKLVTSEDAKSQLFSAFSALDLTDQYDAVLTGLCAKILDASKMSQDQVSAALRDPLSLLEEMARKRITASPRSIMALIDSAVKAHNANQMATVMSLGLQNGSLRQYGRGQTQILALPPTPASRVKCSDGTVRSRQERLDSVDDVPVDERGQEIAQALSTVALLSCCGVINVLGPHDLEPYANIALTSAVAIVALDNFYDLLKATSKLAVAKMSEDNADKINLPDKNSLPLGLGTGQLSGSVVRGLVRLATIDAEREAQCEGAALLAAYVLKLPTFAFRPNALEASVLVAESATSDDSLLSSNGIMRVLVWLLAPVAMESSKHPVCIMSNPREAASFLDRMEEYARNNSALADEIFWADNPAERADLLKWAYTEADIMLREYRKDMEEISNRLSGGAATVGDCVAVLEGW